MKKYIQKLLRENLLGEEIISGKFYHGSGFPKLEWGLAPEDYNRALHGYGVYVSTSMEEAMGYAVESRESGYVFSMNINNLNVVDFYKEDVSDDIKNKLTSMPDFYDGFKIKFNFDDFEFDDLDYQLGNILYTWDYYDEKYANSANKPVGWFLLKFVDREVVYEKYGLKPEDILPLMKQFSNDVSMKDEIIDDEMDFGFTKDNLFDNYHNIYFYMAKKLGSFRESSKLFANLGIVGFKTEGVGIEGVYLDDNDYIVNIINPSHLTDVKRKKVTKEQFSKLYDDADDY